MLTYIFHLHLRPPPPLPNCMWGRQQTLPGFTKKKTIQKKWTIQRLSPLDRTPLWTSVAAVYYFTELGNSKRRAVIKWSSIENCFLFIDATDIYVQKKSKKKHFFHSVFFRENKSADALGKGARHWGRFNFPWQYVSLARKQRSRDWSWPLKFHWIPFTGGKRGVCKPLLGHAWIVWVVHILKFSTESSRQPSFGLNLWLYYWSILLIAANGSTKERWYIIGQVI